ncbi:MAG: ABC-F family ATP-binding cassette domain-containing protein [Bacteroidales bacterium]|nr:ABC-F family ATP-binding cassette domain-containing protein [Bacteroidales bacterium]
MNYLTVENLTKSYNAKILFEEISFGIEKGEKIALIAKNGAGKTTLLNIIAEKDIPENGKVVLRKDLKLSYLHQNPKMNENFSVMEVVFDSDSEPIKTILNYEEILEKVNNSNTPANQKALEKSMQEMDALDAWNYDTKIKEILFRFKIFDLSQKVYELSGGQQKRLALAKIITEKSDFIILDEPTNHLDVDMIEWLESYLNNLNTSLFIVTHDREFLNNVCNEIIELENGNIYRYKGNFSYFLEKKAERESLELREIEKAKNLYRTELDWMRRMPQARATKAKARIDAFYQLETKAKKRIDNTAHELNVESRRMGKKILEIKNISKAFGEKNLIDDFSYTFKRGERIGIVGENGSGKSTFLNLITGLISPDIGEVVKGHTIEFGYYTQEGLKPIKDNKVIDIVKEIAEVVPMGKKSFSVSQFLEYFNFPHSLQYNYYSSLSGGEKRRLYLLITLLKSPNFLILDEPTNDLDILTLNLLENFLNTFQGCLILVSHDRQFMDNLVDHLFVFEGNGNIKDYHSSYSEFRKNKLTHESRLKNLQKSEKEKTEKPKQIIQKATYKQKKEFEKLEIEIDQLESEKKQVIERLNSGNETSEELQKLSSRFGEIEKLLEEKGDRWLELSELM